MTNVILGVIGVIIASLAALISIDYGGDYFIDSENSADAAILQHAASQVQMAHDYYIQRNVVAPADVNALVSTPVYRSFLTGLPFIRGNGTINVTWASDTVGVTPYRTLHIDGVSSPVCGAVNLRANGFTNPAIIPSAPAFREGCFNAVAGQPEANNTFYRFMVHP